MIRHFVSARLMSLFDLTLLCLFSQTLSNPKYNYHFPFNNEETERLNAFSLELHNLTSHPLDSRFSLSSSSSIFLKIPETFNLLLY